PSADGIPDSEVDGQGGAAEGELRPGIEPSAWDFRHRGAAPGGGTFGPDVKVQIAGLFQGNPRSMAAHAEVPPGDGASQNNLSFRARIGPRPARLRNRARRSKHIQPDVLELNDGRRAAVKLQ